MAEPALSWSPDPAAVGVGWALAVVAGVVATVVDDVRGSVLLVVAAVLLGVLALFGTLARPRLRADTEGVTVRGMLSSRSWRWGEVNARLVRTRRFGRESTAVELDADNAEAPALVLLGRLDLGADPVEVADALVRLRT
jgi:hypothetical protein